MTSPHGPSPGDPAPGRVLVTGGCGFIGSALVRHLVAAGHPVTNLDKLTYAASPASLAEVEGSRHYRLVRGDVADAAHVRAALDAGRPEAVVHLAAETHVDRSIDDPMPFVATNVVGTATLLRETLAYWRGLEGGARERFRLLHVSTDEVFGSLGANGLFTEESPYDPSSPYSASKASADHLVRSWHRTFGLPALVSHCSNNYGPYQFPEKLIPLMTVRALRGEPLPVYGTGGNVRDWLHVEDHVAALVALLRGGRPGQSYNVGGASERSNLEVVRAVCATVDELAGPLPSGRPRAGLVTFIADRPGHDGRYATGTAKIERELGWRAARAFEGGLRDTVRWYLDRADWWEPILRERYAGERLGRRG